MGVRQSVTLTLFAVLNSDFIAFESKKLYFREQKYALNKDTFLKIFHS